MPLSVNEAELAMFPTNNFALESNGSIGGSSRVGGGNTFSFRISTNSDDGVLTRKSSRDRCEVERLSTISPDLLMWE